VSDTAFTKRARVVVHGLVQGVFFRESVRRHAMAARVSGWVRNTADGTVEAVFEGDPEGVDRLVLDCRRGPRGARVDRIELFEEDPQGLDGFRVG
jgi:acylphosphatase